MDVPLDDKETMRAFTDIGPLGIETDDILEQPGSAGVPEFGTKNARGMLMETQPTTLEGLIRISGLSHGTNVWRNNAQDIINQGLATINEVISVRDDITTKLIAVGLDKKLSFTISEAVRKGKGLKPEWEEEMRAHDIPEWYIDSCNKIEYMFPRGHAVAYTMMSFRIAWFKVHHPLAYYCVYFSNKLDAFDCPTALQGDAAICKKYRDLKANPKRTAVEDDQMIVLELCHEFCKRGFRFLPMDLYKSDYRSFKIEGDGLRPPFMALAGVGEAAAQSIAEEREKEPFMSQEDISIRCGKASSAVLQSLRDIGALGDLPESNQLDLFAAMF
jgi:DNA polymerase-3 subunit alpha (Gram-positive type)